MAALLPLLDFRALYCLELQYIQFVAPWNMSHGWRVRSLEHDFGDVSDTYGGASEYFSTTVQYSQYIQ